MMGHRHQCIFATQEELPALENLVYSLFEEPDVTATLQKGSFHNLAGSRKEGT